MCFACAASVFLCKNIEMPGKKRAFPLAKRCLSLKSCGAIWHFVQRKGRIFYIRKSVFSPKSTFKFPDYVVIFFV